MRRVLFAVVSTVVGLVALLGFKTHAPEALALGGTGTTGGTGSTGGTTTTTPKTTASAGPSTAATKAASASRTITGSSIDTRYGAVQVEIKVSGKTITAVNAVALPDQDGHSAQISQYCAPILSQEAMSAQTAQIQMISGATFTSDGYIQSLQSAIDQI